MDTKTHIQTDGETVIYTDRHIYRHIYIHKYVHIYRQTDTLIDE